MKHKVRYKLMTMSYFVIVIGAGSLNRALFHVMLNLSMMLIKHHLRMLVEAFEYNTT